MVTKTNIRKHPRKTKRGRTIVRKHKRKVKRTQRLGSKWRGDKYVHGPRKMSPKKCSKFRVGKVINKEGQRLVFCKLKGRRNEWAVQSKLTPINRSSGSNKKLKDWEWDPEEGVFVNKKTGEQIKPITDKNRNLGPFFEVLTPTLATTGSSDPGFAHFFDRPKKKRKRAADGGGFGDILGEAERRAKLQKKIEKLAARLIDTEDTDRKEELVKRIRMLKKRRDI